MNYKRDYGKLKCFCKAQNVYQQNKLTAYRAEVELCELNFSQGFKIKNA